MLHTHSIVPVYLPYQHNALRWIDTDTVFLRLMLQSYFAPFYIRYTPIISSLIRNILSLTKSYILYISSGSSFLGE